MRESAFDLAHRFVARWEGGISNNHYDRGGITAYGASIAYVKDLAASSDGRQLLRRIGVSTRVTPDTIRYLTRWQVMEMFRFSFWDALDLNDFDPRLSCVLYDCAVNSGKKRSILLAQKAVNAINSKAAPDAGPEIIDEDGIMGPVTRQALGIPSPALISEITNQRRVFLQNIVKNRPNQKVFLRGWLNRVNDLEKYIKSKAFEEN